MPISGFNVGHDVTINIVNPLTGQVITFGNVTDFDSMQVTKQVESSPLSAPPIFGEIPHGWQGSVTVDRTTSSTDDYFAQLEALYWTTGSNLIAGSIHEYIQESQGPSIQAAGPVTQYLYQGAVFKFSNAGRKVSQDKITMKLDWRCSQRLKIT